MRKIFLLGSIIYILLAHLVINSTMATPDRRLNKSAIHSLYQKPHASSYRFVVTGDNRDGDKILLKVLEQAQQHHPKFAIHTGDFVSSGTQQQYQRFIGYLANTPFPVLPTLGNHDAYQQGRQWYNQYFGPSYYAFDYGPDRFIMVDNANGQISEGQLTWLENQLKTPKRYKFVAMHMPPINIVWFHAFSGESATKMMAIVEKYQANYAFFGHIHIYDKMVRNGVNYVVSGGSGAPLYRMPLYISPDGGAFNHYILMDVSDEGIKEQVIKLQ